MSAEGEDGGEKSFEASPKKLEDARRKGEIPRSPDLNTAAAYAGLWLAALTLGGWSLLRLGEILMGMIEAPERLAVELVSPQGRAAAGGLLAAVGLAVLPLFAAPALGTLLSVAAQRAWLFTPDKLAPKLSRLSPVSGAKQKFGPDGLFAFAKSALKMAIVSAALAWFLARELPGMLVMASLGPGPATAALMRLLPGALLPVLVVAVAVGAADWLWQSASHLRKNRMTRKEMTDEHKEAEGDPHFKAHRRARAQEIAARRMMSEVPTADVVIVNPTHYAVALRWSRKPGSAPTVVAKGVDEIARRIRERAAEAGVPIRSDPPTARALHDGVELGREIPPEQYRAVAAAIRFAEAMRTRSRRR
jgi:flagellar biosynthetic protein FlhB